MWSDLPKVHLARYLIRLGMAEEARGRSDVWDVYGVASVGGLCESPR